MYAVIEQGGKQYKVAQGDKIEIELVDIDDSAQQIELDKVLMVGQGKEAKVGSPYIEGAKVIGKFAPTAAEAVKKGPKLYPAYRRRRKNSKTKIGHRQKHMLVTIDKIEA